MKKLKAIHLSPASHSFFGKEDLKRRLVEDWYSFTAQQVKKYHPEIEVECWCPEKIYKKQEEFVYSNIKYRQFPTIFAPVYGLDFSLEILKELKKRNK